MPGKPGAYSGSALVDDRVHTIDDFHVVDPGRHSRVLSAFAVFLNKMRPLPDSPGRNAADGTRKLERRYCSAPWPMATEIVSPAYHFCRKIRIFHLEDGTSACGFVR